MTITTKTGDKGTTAIKDRRLSKADTLIVALGDLDECSSLIIHMQAQLKLDVSIWEPIVNELYHMSAVLSGFSPSEDFSLAIKRFEAAILHNTKETMAEDATSLFIGYKRQTTILPTLFFFGNALPSIPRSVSVTVRL